MTDRHAGYIVVLEKDIREDDAANTLVALHCIKGVLSVEPVTVDAGIMIAEARAKSDWFRKLVEVMHPPRKE